MDTIEKHYNELLREFHGNYRKNEMPMNEVNNVPKISHETRFIFKKLAELQTIIGKLKNESKKFEMCCALCKKHETSDCPVLSADPWSRHKNYCNEFVKIFEAVEIKKC